MTRSALIAITVVLLLGGTSLASAKSRTPAGAHHHGLKGDQISRTKNQPSAIPQVVGPGINETASRPPAAEDPYHGLFGFYAVPPYGPGYAYGYVRPIGR